MRKEKLQIPYIFFSFVRKRRETHKEGGIAIILAGAIFRLHPIICSIKSFNHIVFDVQYPGKLGMEL